MVRDIDDDQDTKTALAPDQHRAADDMPEGAEAREARRNAELLDWLRVHEPEAFKRAAALVSKPRALTAETWHAWIRGLSHFARTEAAGRRDARDKLGATGRTIRRALEPLKDRARRLKVLAAGSRKV